MSRGNCAPAIDIVGLRLGSDSSAEKFHFGKRGLLHADRRQRKDPFVSPSESNYLRCARLLCHRDTFLTCFLTGFLPLAEKPPATNVIKDAAAAGRKFNVRETKTGAVEDAQTTRWRHFKTQADAPLLLRLAN